MVQSEAYTDEGLANTAVEGEHYVRDHVRSSTLVALGLADASALSINQSINHKAIAIGRLSIESMQQSSEPLTEVTIRHFHYLDIGDEEDPRALIWRTKKTVLRYLSCNRV